MSVYLINKKFRAVGPVAAATHPSDRVLRVAEMFGIGLDESYEVTLYENLRLEIRSGDVVYITGPSGTGKSVLVAHLSQALRRTHPEAQVVDFADVKPPPGTAVIDGLPAGFEAALRILSTAGLADAFLLLRSPEQLSDGQRWRLRLAHALARLLGLVPTPSLLDGRLAAKGPAAAQEVASLCREPPVEKGSERTPSGQGRGRKRMRVLVADELASRLDRPCARAIAYRLRRAADRWGLTVLAASAHDDLVEDLAPDILVIKHAGDQVEVHYADPVRRSPAATTDPAGKAVRSNKEGVRANKEDGETKA